MVTASSIAASASSRRPRSASRTDRLFSELARSGRNASGRAAASSRWMVTASSIAASASSRRPRSRQPDRQVVQRRGQVGAERVRAGRGQLPVDGDGFLDRGQRLLPPPQVGQPDRQVVQRRWPGRGGTRPGGPRPAPGRWSAASSIAASASSRRPRSASRTDRLFSDLARSGRNASGRAAASSRRMVTASSIAASASSRRPRSASRTDRLFSDVARSGRNASGRAAASSR